MSILRKLFGGTFESNRNEGEVLFAEGRFGEAKLCFERAISRSKKASQDEVEAIREKVKRCKLEIAMARIIEADREAAAGDLGAAIDQLREAREVCGEQQIIDAIQERLRSYEAEDARQLVGDVEEIDEDELLAVIAGTWNEAQADEYAALPDELRHALLAGHDGDHGRAAEILEALLKRGNLAVSPCYAWMELGRELLLADRPEESIEAFDAFFMAVGEDGESAESLITAGDLRSAALSALGRFDEAKEQLIHGTRINPEDHTVFLRLGVFLRDRGEHASALEALERARDLMGQMNPDFRVVRELGFTYLAMERKDEAMGCLGAVIEHLASRGEHSQFDPVTAVALARLHEEKGDTMQAADLYRHLAVGYDTQNHFVYNVEAARLLKLAGAEASLQDRYITRARELAESPEQLERLEKVRSSRRI